MLSCVEHEKSFITSGPWHKFYQNFDGVIMKHFFNSKPVMGNTYGPEILVLIPLLSNKCVYSRVPLLPVSTKLRCR